MTVRPCGAIHGAAFFVSCFFGLILHTISESSKEKLFVRIVHVSNSGFVYNSEGGEQLMIAELGPSCNVEEEFSRLVSQYQRQLLHMCAMYLHDSAAAEDAVQETFLTAYRALPQFRGECSEKTWLMRIAMNTCRDMTRSAWFRHNDRRITPEELQLPVQQNFFDDQREELAQAIMKLPRKYKDALLLYYYQDMTQDEVAQALNTSPSSISKRLKHAREKLRILLERGQNREG